MWVCVHCTCVCVISERLNQENGKTYGTDFLGTKLWRSQKVFLNRSVVSGLNVIDGFVPQIMRYYKGVSLFLPLSHSLSLTHALSAPIYSSHKYSFGFDGRARSCKYY